MPARLHAVVTGSVQGVSFRWFTMRAASGLGLTGWVRNRADGAVEVVAEGKREALEELLGKLRRGPSLARVSDVEIRWESPTGEFQGFGIGPGDW